MYSKLPCIIRSMYVAKRMNVRVVYISECSQVATGTLVPCRTCFLLNLG